MEGHVVDTVNEYSTKRELEKIYCGIKMILVAIVMILVFLGWNRHTLSHHSNSLTRQGQGINQLTAAFYVLNDRIDTMNTSLNSLNDRMDRMNNSKNGSIDHIVKFLHTFDH